MLGMFHEFLFKVVMLNGNKIRFASPNITKYIIAKEYPSANFARDANSLLQVVDALCDEEITDDQVRQLCQLPAPTDQAPKPNMIFGGVLAHVIVKTAKTWLQKYPLIMKTAILERALIYDQPYDFVLQKDIQIFYLFYYFLIDVTHSRQQHPSSGTLSWRITRLRDRFAIGQVPHAIPSNYDAP